MAKILPAILPNLFVIVRMNLFGAWTGVLAAEMVGVNTGLGTIVMVGRRMMSMNLTFLGMALSPPTCIFPTRGRKSRW